MTQHTESWLKSLVNPANLIPLAALIFTIGSFIYNAKQPDKGQGKVTVEVENKQENQKSNSIGAQPALSPLNLEPLNQAAKSGKFAAQTMFSQISLQELKNLASKYQSQGKYQEAETFYTKALEITKKRFGKDHPQTKTISKSLADLRKKIKQ